MTAYVPITQDSGMSAKSYGTIRKSFHILLLMVHSYKITSKLSVSITLLDGLRDSVHDVY